MSKICIDKEAVNVTFRKHEMHLIEKLDSIKKLYHTSRSAVIKQAIDELQIKGKK